MTMISFTQAMRGALRRRVRRIASAAEGPPTTSAVQHGLDDAVRIVSALFIRMEYCD